MKNVISTDVDNEQDAKAITEVIGRFDAIALDTSIFDSQGLALERGLLAQLAQFRIGSIPYLLSEVVLGEVKAHLIAAGIKASDKLSSAIGELRRQSVVDQSTLENLNAVANDIDVEAWADNRLNAHRVATGAVVVSADGASGKLLTSMYFAPMAPFGPGEKKAEFPDAIALLSLKAWAETNDAHVLAVSNDSGWHQFANDNPERLTVTRDLAAALDAVQEDNVHARAQVIAIITSQPTVADAVRRAALDGMAALEMDAEANASSYYETTDSGFFPESAEIAIDEEIAIIQSNSHRIVSRIPVTVDGVAVASFAFHHWDNFDREFIGMGAVNASRDFKEYAAVLLTLERDSKAPEHAKVIEVEFIDADPSIDFGTIEPDYGEDHFNDPF